MILPLWLAGAGGGCAIVAVASGLADRRRTRRTDPDRVGWVDWRSVQMAAMLGVTIAAGLALKG